jgi:hypothetical protein
MLGVRLFVTLAVLLASMPALAQVRLRLVDTVDPATGTVMARVPLPPGTRVALIDSMSYEPVPLSPDVLSAAQPYYDTIDAQGLTVGTHETTPASRQARYLVARTPDGALYHSFILSSRGYIPGFTGLLGASTTDVPMGPIARADHRAVTTAFPRLLEPPARPLLPVAGVHLADGEPFSLALLAHTLAMPPGAPVQQESIQFTLRAAPDGVFSRGTPLPPGTRIAVLDSATANRGAVRLRSFQADALARAATARYDSLHGDGSTYEVYPSTPESDRAYYVVARTPEGELYQSVVKAGGAGVLPGYDAVFSGNMTLAPVEAGQARQLLAALPGLTPAPSTPAAPVATPAEVRPTERPAVVGAVNRSSSNNAGWLWLLGGALLGGVGATLLARRRNTSRRQADAHEGAARSVGQARRQGTRGAERLEQLYREACAERDKWRAEFEHARQDAAELQNTVRQLRAAGEQPHSQKEIAHLQARVEELRSRVRVAETIRQERDALREQLDELQAVSEIPSTPEPPISEGSASPSEEVAQPVDEPGAVEPSQLADSHEPLQAGEAAISTLFASWCGRPSPIVPRYYMFERELRKDLPNVRVYPAFASASGHVSRESNAGAEFWVVENGASAFALPAPRSAQAFRSLAPLFESDSVTAPGDVQEVAPALLMREGMGFALNRAGTLR